MNGPRPLLKRKTIERRIKQLAREIGEAHAGRELLVLVVLDGAVFFAADLVRHIHDVDLRMHYCRASSYTGTSSSGTVTFADLPDCTGRDILVVEDILDTGLTLSRLVPLLLHEGAASVETCVLLDKPSGRQLTFHADRVGFAIGDAFVVGYGMDWDDRFRSLPDICTIDPAG